jgi:L-serine deaminase
VPCIERNAIAASRALDACTYSALSDGKHKIDFDHILQVMKETGHDLPSLYKETSTGGIAKIDINKRRGLRKILDTLHIHKNDDNTK